MMTAARCRCTIRFLVKYFIVIVSGDGLSENGRAERKVFRPGRPAPDRLNSRELILSDLSALRHESRPHTSRLSRNDNNYY